MAGACVSRMQPVGGALIRYFIGRNAPRTPATRFVPLCPAGNDTGVSTGETILTVRPTSALLLTDTRAHPASSLSLSLSLYWYYRLITRVRVA